MEREKEEGMNEKRTSGEVEGDAVELLPAHFLCGQPRAIDTSERCRRP